MTRAGAAAERLHELPDEELVERAQAGSPEAFEELVRRHADRLHAVLLRFTASPEEAQEAAQEAFLRAWRAIGRFQGRAQFFTWLYRIGINEATRRAGRRAPSGVFLSPEEHPVEQVADSRPGPVTRTEHRELRTGLERAIGELPPDYRAPLVLRDIEGLSTREAAQILELGEAAFKSRLHRARMAVRESLGPLLEGDE